MTRRRFRGRAGPRGLALALTFGLAGGCADSPPRPRVAPGGPVDLPLPPESLDRLPTGEGLTARPALAEPASLPASVEDAMAAIVTNAIAAGKLPGCVVVVGRHDAVLVARAFGSRSLVPSKTPMTLDTVFDLASLTKPVATAASVLVLADRGQVELDAPLRTYLPELGERGRGTLRQALTHTAGFAADTPYADYANGLDVALARIARAPLRYEPGAETRYSDVGFIVLGEVVRRVTGKDLAAYAEREVYKPLGMAETGFLPSPALRLRAAPTEQVDGRWLKGEVHDPRARLLGGVAGHAGLFSTAADLTRLAQSLLGGGATFLSRAALRAFTAPHDVPHAVRALGWDVASAYSANRGTSLSPRAFGHGGYTGTSLWVDPAKDLFVLFLSNRVHPDGHGAVNNLAGAIADLAASAVGEDERRLPVACGKTVAKGGSRVVATGLDVLVGESFAPLAGAHVGLLTNGAGLTRDGQRDLDLFAAATGFTTVALFSPEHGLATDQDALVKDGRDTKTNLPVFSLYGDHFAPTSEELTGIDTLVVNLPDVGTRFFTYASTVHRVLRAAASRGIRVVILDRPNPIDGVRVEGPPLAGAKASFVNHAPLPVRHGMTLGELALLFDAGEHLGTVLDVVRVRGWARDDLWDDTGLAWVPPSPNLRTAREALLYPGVALLEATNVSVGRGTDSPFEMVGAPFVDGETLSAALAKAGLKGVRVEPTRFTPVASRFHGEACSGVKLTVTDPETFEPVTLGIALAVALHALYPAAWKQADLLPLLASAPALLALERGEPVETVVATWKAPLAEFLERRAKFLLYPARSCPPEPSSASQAVRR